MTSTRWFVAALFLIIVVLAPAALAQTAPEECMDCGEKRTKRFNAEGVQLWPEYSEALCCDFACYGGYEIIDLNVGWGCNTLQVNNELVVGSICKSSRLDQNCGSGSTGGGGGTGTGTFDQDGDSSSCARINGYCPTWCPNCP